MDRKKDRRLAKTDRAIKEAILELCAELPLSKITVSAVAERADISRKTFYLHFDTVDDAYASFASDSIDICMRGLDERLGELQDKGAPLVDVFRLYFRHVGALFEDGDLVTHRRRLDNIPYDALLRHFEAPLRKAIAGGRMGPYLPDDHFDYYVAFLLNLTVGTYSTWLRTGMRETLEELADMASVLASQGVSGLMARGEKPAR